MTEPDRVVVVNADDLGLHEDVNRGVIDAHQRGFVTSASIIACGRGAENAFDLVKSNPDLDIGVHLTLIEEFPLCPASEVESLVDGSGHFYGSYKRFVAEILCGRITRADVYRELDRQISHVLDQGLDVTHLDSHQHIHVLPMIWEVVVALARTYQIQYLRIPRFDRVLSRNPMISLARMCLNGFSGLRRGSDDLIRSADFTPGLHLSGRVSVDALLRVFEELQSGLSEIVVHPGRTTPSLTKDYSWGFDWSGETEALRSDVLRRALDNSLFRLTNFRNLLSEGRI